ncbi:MAG TPA: hypothetical protein VJN67_10735 [Stellaceae bacterium]|nr:hypothetical protein [Stellaceae bacterium]
MTATFARRAGYRDAVFFRLYRRGPARDVLTLLRSGGTGWSVGD